MICSLRFISVLALVYVSLPKYGFCLLYDRYLHIGYHTERDLVIGVYVAVGHKPNRDGSLVGGSHLGWDPELPGRRRRRRNRRGRFRRIRGLGRIGASRGRHDRQRADCELETGHAQPPRQLVGPSTPLLSGQGALRPGWGPERV